MLPLSPDRALIFRISHIDNIPSILSHGIRCRSSSSNDPGYRNIGNPELIERRAARRVPAGPGGTLSDYVPFYFTSRTPMLLNIKTGRNVPAVPMRDIVILVSSLPRLAANGAPFVFTDSHAYLHTARFSSDLADLDRIDWEILKRSDFSYDPNDPGKMDRYQAEALVHERVPVEALGGIISYSRAQQVHLDSLLSQADHAIKVVTRPEYFF